MHLPSDASLPEISFSITSRPLKFLFCVANSRDFDEAIGFFTHAWGGNTNWILPIPTHNEREAFMSAFDRFDPDYVILPKRGQEDQLLIEITTWLSGICPARLMSLSPESILPFAERRGRIGCRLKGRSSYRMGEVPLASPQLSYHHQGGLKPEDSRVVVCPSPQRGDSLSLWTSDLPSTDALSPEAIWHFSLRLKVGLPCDRYQEYLTRGLGASMLPLPTDFRSSLFSQLVCCERATPISLTTTGCKVRGINLDSEANAVMLSRSCIGLYLLDDPPMSNAPEQREEWFARQLSTLCAFWNTHGASGSGIVLLKSEFKSNIELVFQTCRDVLDQMKGVYIVTQGNDATLEELQRECEQSLRSELSNEEAWVVVKRPGFDFPSGCLRALSGSGAKINLSAPLRRDGSVVFRPPVPQGLDEQDEIAAFACNIEVKGQDGQRLALPDSLQSSLLLSLSAETIAWGERADKQSDPSSQQSSRTWRQLNLSAASVRSTWDGVTVIATYDEETFFFLPEEEAAVRRYIESQTGVELQPNRNTRYVTGVINRAGGQGRAMKLVHSQALPILKVLSSSAAYQCGLSVEQIAERTRTSSTEKAASGAMPDLSPNEKKKAGQIERQKHRLETEEHLRQLLETDLVRRGVAQHCPLCDLTEWLPLSKVAETVECPGCGSTFALPFEKLAFQFKANELVIRCLASGGAAVLETSAALRRVENAGSLLFGAEVKLPGQSEPEVEIDLLWLVNETLIVAECKSFEAIRPKQLEELRASLPKGLNAAKLLGAKALLVGVSTKDLNIAALWKEMEAIQEEANTCNVALHLIVNGQFWPKDATESVETWRMRLEDLIPAQNSPTKPNSTFGNWPSPWEDEAESRFKPEAIIEMKNLLIGAG